MSRPCDCGSGLDSHWENDARGIPLARVCPKCRAKKLSGFRPEVLTDSQYEVDEEIEPDDGFDLFVKQYPAMPDLDA